MITYTGGGGIPVFEGARYQRGYGLGSIFGSLFKSAIPLLKSGAKSLGKEALKTGVAIGQDVLSGENIKTASKRRVRQSAKKVAQNSLRKLQQRGGGTTKRNNKPRKRVITIESFQPRRKPSRGVKRSRSRSPISRSSKRFRDIFDS